MKGNFSAGVGKIQLDGGMEQNKIPILKVYFPEEYPEIRRCYLSSGYKIIELDTEKFDSEHRLFVYLATKLKFPSYFGFNWDALEECLEDLEWLKNTKIAFVVSTIPRKETNEKSLLMFLQILLDVIAYHKKNKKKNIEIVLLSKNDLEDNQFIKKLGAEGSL